MTGWDTIPLDGHQMGRLIDGIAQGRLHWRSMPSAPKTGASIIIAFEGKPNSAVALAAWKENPVKPFPFTPTHWMPSASVS